MLDLSKAAACPAWLADRYDFPPWCLLCGAPAAYVGLWVPHAGAKRAIAYLLCWTCCQRADERVAEIEDAVKARLAAPRN